MLSVKLKVALWAVMAIFVPEAHGFNWFSSDPDESSLDAILGSNFANEESPLDHEAWKFERLLREGPIQTQSTRGVLKGFTFQSHDWSEEREIASILDIQRLHDIELSTVEVTKIAQTEFDIPIRSHPLVDHYLTLFQGRGRRFFQRWLDKSEIFIPIMAPILASYDLPADIVYLAMIESGYSGTATSPAAAAGFWQFMPATGRQYGLRQNRYVDERRDFILATHAAARFLTRLYHKFGDWHLAFASYNAGDGRIGRALKKHRVDNYWDLIAVKGSLAKETKHYVPKLIAAATIAKNPEAYGFERRPPRYPLRWDTIEAPPNTELSVIAREFKLSTKELKKLNPGLIKQLTPPSGKTSIRVPRGFGRRASFFLAQLPKEQRRLHVKHKVRRGDTLFDIAARYGASATSIREANNISNARRLQAGKVLLIPTSSMTTTPVEPKVAVRKTPAKAPTSVKRKSLVKKAPKRKAVATEQRSYRVRSGDTLWSIAKRFNLSVKELRKLNQLRGNTIRVGALLRLM